MGKGVYGVMMKLLRAENFRCTVVATHMHTPAMRAFRISAPELINACRPVNGEYLRGWFREPEHPHKEAMRGYTFVDIDEAAGEFTLLFLLHEPAGPASAWAKRAKVGDSFEACYYGSKPFIMPEPRPEGFVFIADAAAIPYVNAITSQLAGEFPVKVWMLDWYESDHDIPIDHYDNLTVEWIEPSNEALLARAQEFEWQGWFPHLTCESKVLLPTRRFLLKEAGVSKDFLHSHAYWVKGKAMGNSREASDG